MFLGVNLPRPSGNTGSRVEVWEGFSVRAQLLSHLVYLDASAACNSLAFELGQTTGVGSSISTRQWNIKVIIKIILHFTLEHSCQMA